MTTQNFSKQIPKNLAINIVSFISTVVIGLWLTPYLLKHLGIAAYGLIPLAMFLSQYVSVIINAINMSINRFLLIELQKNNDKNANEIFNTALVILSGFIIVQVVIMGIILFDITQFFTIPESLIVDATWLFGLTFIGFSISLFRSVFGTSMFAYNRLDILRTIDIVQNVVRVLSIVILFTYDTPSLKSIGIANLLASLSAVFPTLYYFKKFTPQIKIKITSFSKQRVAELSKMSIWVLINQVGVLLLGNIDLYLVNSWIGAESTGEYAIVLQFTSIFKTVLTLLSSIFIPAVMIYYANEEWDKLKYFIVLVSKIMLLIMLLPLVFLIVFSKEILILWLGNSYIYLSEIISFSLLLFVFLIPVIPLFSITLAYNKVKLPALITIYFGLINILSIYMLLLHTQMGLWSIVSVRLLLEIFFSFFILTYVSRILVLPIFRLLKIYILSIILFIVFFFSVYLLKILFIIDTFFKIFMLFCVLFIFVMPLLFVILFTTKDKNILYAKYPLLVKIKKRYK